MSGRGMPPEGVTEGSLWVDLANGLINVFTLGGIERGTIDPVQEWGDSGIGDDR